MVARGTDSLTVAFLVEKKKIWGMEFYFLLEEARREMGIAAER